MNHEKKIPTLVAIGALALLFGVVSVITQRFIRQPTQAEAQKNPSDIQISNITDTTFTITWKTQKPVLGTIQVKSTADLNQKPLLFLDDRASSGTLEKYTLHSVTARGLTPQTTYAVFLGFDQEIPQKNPHQLTISTFPTLENGTNTLSPIYGKVLKADNSPQEGALVFATFTGSQTVSTLTKSSGSYVIPINRIRTQDGSSYLTPNDMFEISMQVDTDTEKTTAIIAANQSSPVPDLVVGTNIDTRKSESVKPVEQQKESTFTTVLGTNTHQEVSPQPKLLRPEQNARLISQYPLFSGIALPETSVTLTIGKINPYTVSVQSKNDGTWIYNAPKPLPPGKQSVTMTTTQESGTPVAFTHMFEILKSGTQVLGEATPSGTPIVTPTEIPAIETPTPTPTVPTTGSITLTNSLLIVGIILTMLGGIVLIL